MDLTKTRVQLVNKALANLNVVGTGQSAEAEDVATVDGYVDSVFLSLAARDVIDLTAQLEANAIPAETFLALAHCIAAAASSEYGRPADQALIGLASLAEEQLKVIARPAPSRKTLVTDPILRVGAR